MTWGQLRDWVAAGHEVGNHTFTHACLPLCDSRRIEQECLWGKQELEDRLGVAVRHFAYPYGEFNQRCEMTLTAMACHDTLATCLRGAMPVGHSLARLRRNQLHPAFSPSQVVLRLKAADRFHGLWLLRRKRGYRFSHRRGEERFDPLPETMRPHA